MTFAIIGQHVVALDKIAVAEVGHDRRLLLTFASGVKLSADVSVEEGSEFDFMTGFQRWLNAYAPRAHVSAHQHRMALRRARA